MNEDAVTKWIFKAENDLKTGKDELVTKEPATATVFPYAAMRRKVFEGFLNLSR